MKSFLRRMFNESDFFFWTTFFFLANFQNLLKEEIIDQKKSFLNNL